MEGRVVSTTEVFDKISSRLVPFEMVAKVFKDMTSEGGKFYNMQEVQAETLKGKISNLKDAYEVMLNEIGKNQSENLKGAVDWARRLMTNYEDTGRVLVELITAYGVYKAAVIALTLATNTFTLANHKLLSSLVQAATWASKNPYVLLAAGVTAAGFAIYKNLTALEGYEKVHKSFLDTEKKYGAELATEQAKLDSLYATLKVAKEGTDEYAEAKKDLYTNYAGYISELRDEGVAVDDLATLYDNLKIKLEEAAKARFALIAKQDIDQVFATEVQKIYNRFDKLKEGINERLEFENKPLLDADNTAAFMQYITGGLSWSEIANDPRYKQLSTVLNGLHGSTKEYADKLRAEMSDLKKTYAEDTAAITKIYGEFKTETTDDETDVVVGGGGDSAEQKAIEAQIKSIQKLKSAYEDLLPYLDEVQMKSTLKEIFPNIGEGIIDSLDFNAELERLADELEVFDKDAAQRLRDTISKDVAGAMADSFRALEQYKKMLDSWLGEDYNLIGEGTAFDISKILSNLNSEYAKIDQKRKNALDLLNKAQIGDEIALAKVREIYGEETWEKYLEKGEGVINELAQKERAAARATANEKIRDLADKDLKERMEKANINLTDFDDKTLAQVEEMYDRLFELHDELQAELEEMMADGVTEDEIANLQRLEDELRTLGIIINDTRDELEKKIYDTVKDSAIAIGELGSSVSRLGEAMGNANVAKFGQQLSETAKMAVDFMEALKAKDTIAIISNIASFVVSRITSLVTAAWEEQTRLNDAALEYAEILNGIRRESYSGIFGTDEMALAAENQKILAEAQEKYNAALKKFQNDRQWRTESYFDRVTFKSLSVSDVLKNIADSQGWDLYKQSGELDMEAVMAYYDAYAEHLTNKQKEVVDTLIASYEAQDSAAEASAEYMTSLFSSAADSIAESMVNAFLESGSAATDLRNVVSDVASQMASDLIKSLYIMPILNDYAKELEAISDNSQLTADEKAAQALAVLQKGIERIQNNEGVINETLEKFDEYFVRENEETKEMGAGIKGITEDQANLLASYLNAIRADVSYSKALWVRMDSNLQRIADMLTSSPTLMEYQAQIAANTYDTAMASQSILSELRSVITTDSGDTAIRIHS